MAAKIHPIDPAGDVWELSNAKITAASVALTAIASCMESMGLFVRSARKPDADRAGIDQHILTLQSEIRAAAHEARFDEPWGASRFLAGKWREAASSSRSDGGLEQDESLDGNGEAAGEASLADFDGSRGLCSAANATETGILSFKTAEASESELDLIIQNLAEGLSGVNMAQNLLGTLSESLDERSHRDLVFGAGIRSLVDADMDETSTRIAALDIQQKLCVQSLSIANDNAAIILKLLG